MLKVTDNPDVTPVACLGVSVFDRAEADRADRVALDTKPPQARALAAYLVQLGVESGDRAKNRPQATTLSAGVSVEIDPHPLEPAG